MKRRLWSVLALAGVVSFLSVTAVPVPVAMALFGLALTTWAGGACCWRRRQAQQLDMKLSSAKRA